MQPLIDADVLRYEVGFAAEAGWQKDEVPPWDYVQEHLELRIANICGAVGATAPPILYLTGKHNFREQLATRQPYKDRPSNKPWHFKNITAFMEGNYDVRIQDGLEADDLMAIEQTRRNREEALLCDKNPMSIICTRDKDLRAVPGWHYGWELGNQPSFGPYLTDEIGYITLSSDRKSIKGTGLLFFYSQCLTGDRTDSILGVERLGPVKAFEILSNTKTPDEAFKAVREAYRAVYGDDGDNFLLESGRLLWMTRELHEDGSPVLWEFPKGE
jgi:5'-3' exonuclease